MTKSYQTNIKISRLFTAEENKARGQAPVETYQFFGELPGIGADEAKILKDDLESITRDV